MHPTTDAPRELLHGTVLGLVLMAVFTTAWSANTLSTWSGVAGTAVTGVGVLASAWFVVTAARLVRLARRSGPAAAPSSPEERRAQRRRGRAFGGVFAAEGVLILAAAAGLGALGRPDLVLPAIALVVGLHFYPMAGIFERRLDTWLATGLTLVGAAGLVALLAGADRDTVWGLVACGAALTTGRTGCTSRAWPATCSPGRSGDRQRPPWGSTTADPLTGGGPSTRDDPGQPGVEAGAPAACGERSARATRPTRTRAAARPGAVGSIG